MKTTVRKWMTWLLGGVSLLACLGCSLMSEGGGRMGVVYETRHSMYLFNETDGDKQGNTAKTEVKSTLLEDENDPE